MTKEVAILTKSSKHGGFCVAGVDLDTGEWVRLVSDDVQSHGALSRRDITYEDRSICTPLDVPLWNRSRFPKTYCHFSHST